jgi:hypothetical protein
MKVLMGVQGLRSRVQGWMIEALTAASRYGLEFRVQGWMIEALTAASKWGLP